jgi:MFS family permease
MSSFLNMFGEYKLALQSAHKNVRYFFIASFLAQIGGGFTWVLYNLYIKSLGLPDPVAGLCVSAGSIANVVSLVPAGILTDRFGRKRMIMIAGALSGAVTVLQAFVESSIFMVITAFLAGVVNSVIWVSILPLLAENTEPEERFHLFSVNFAIGLFAQILGSLVGGSLSETLAHTGLNEVWAIRTTLLFGAALSIISLAPFSRIQETKKSTDGERKKTSLRQSWARLKERREQFSLIAKFMFASTMIGFGAGLVIPYLNLYFTERFHMTRSSIGLITAIGQILTAVAMFIGPATAKRMGAVKSVVMFQMLSIPFLLVTGWSMNEGLVCTSIVIRNALMNCSTPIQDSIMMALVDDDLKGLSVSCGQTMWTLGWAVMGPISTSIVKANGQYVGYGIVFTCTAVLYFIGSSFYMWAFRRYESKVYSADESTVSA